MTRDRYVSEFCESGDRILEMLKVYGDLRSTDRVLDVGCGIGRVARSLTRYLDTNASYDGFDIVLPAIEYCREAYGGKFPQFGFHHMNIEYGKTEPSGLSPDEVRFPFSDNSFDFVFSISLFTHLRPAPLSNYVSEMNRVLVRGGVCLNTFFLLDDFAHEALRQGSTTHRFPYRGDGYYAKRGSNVEAGVAYDEATVRRLYTTHDLEIVEPVRFGSWSGRRDNLYSYQDAIVARKAP